MFAFPRKPQGVTRSISPQPPEYFFCQGICYGREQFAQEAKSFLLYGSSATGSALDSLSLGFTFQEVRKGKVRMCHIIGCAAFLIDFAGMLNYGLRFCMVAPDLSQIT